MAKKLVGRVALVTGGSRGIGRAAALALAAQGAAVAVNFLRDRAAAETVCGEIRELGQDALAVQADVGDRAAVEEMVSQVSRELGPIGILVNNAGLLFRSELLQHDPAEFEAMWRTNVQGVVHCSAAVAPAMIGRRKGSIVNLSSIAALGTAFPGTTLYAATKAAVIALTKRFAYELGPHGINVNAVCPGFIATDMVFQGRAAEEVEKSLAAAGTKAMLGRAGKPEDVARVILFLASEDAAFMSAQILTVDGGRLDFLTGSA